MFAPQASHICPPPGVSCTFIILPNGRRPPSSLRRMTKRTTSRSIKVSPLKILGCLRPSHDYPDATVLDHRGDIIRVHFGIVNAVARHSWRVQYWCLSRPSARLPFAAEARGVVQLETFSRAYIAGLWEVIGGGVLGGWRAAQGPTPVLGFARVCTLRRA